MKGYCAQVRGAGFDIGLSVGRFGPEPAWVCLSACDASSEILAAAQTRRLRLYAICRVQRRTIGQRRAAADTNSGSSPGRSERDQVDHARPAQQPPALAAVLVAPIHSRVPPSSAYSASTEPTPSTGAGRGRT
jgi:hypothetical protein